MNEDLVDVEVGKPAAGGKHSDGVDEGHRGRDVEDVEEAGREADKIQEVVTGDGVDPAEVSEGAPRDGVGGYLAYMAGDDDVDNGDPDEKAGEHGVDLPSDMSTGARSSGFSNSKGRKQSKPDPAVYQSSGQGDEDDGVLYSMPAGWNRLGIVLRDKGVYRFVKYVSQMANGDRWDVCGEYTVVNQEVEEEGGEVLDNAGQIYDSDDTTEHEEETTSDDD